MHGPPEDEGIGANIETKDAWALLRFKRSGRLDIVSEICCRPECGLKRMNRPISVNLTNIDAPRGFSRLDTRRRFAFRVRVSCQQALKLPGFLKLNNLLQQMNGERGQECM